MLREMHSKAAHVKILCHKPKSLLLSPEPLKQTIRSQPHSELGYADVPLHTLWKLSKLCPQVPSLRTRCQDP